MKTKPPRPNERKRGGYQLHQKLLYFANQKSLGGRLTLIAFRQVSVEKSLYFCFGYACCQVHTNVVTRFRVYRRPLVRARLKWLHVERYFLLLEQCSRAVAVSVDNELSDFVNGDVAAFFYSNVCRRFFSR